MNIQSNEYLLLLGAGFTKNFGAPLAREMWDLIASHEIIQVQPRIKKLMQYDDNYESIYYSVLGGFEDKKGLFGEKGKCVKFTCEEKKMIVEATNSAYEHIDETLIKFIEDIDKQGAKNVLTNISHFISSFLRGEILMTSDGYILATSDGYILMTAPDKYKKVFIFTLNQDLFFERTYQKYNNIELHLPGIKNEQNWVRNGINKKLTDSDLCELPSENELNDEDILLKGNYFIIKLHGSYDWTRLDGSRAMVIGRDKETQIQKEPLLSRYFDIFKEVLSQGQRRLLIVGYGFGDAHINRELSKAVTCYGLKIYILSPESPKAFKEKLFEGLEKSEDAINICKGISGYFQCVEDILLKEVDGNKVREIFDNIFFLDILEDNNWKC